MKTYHPETNRRRKINWGIIGALALYSTFYGAAEYFHLRKRRWAEAATFIVFCLIVLVWNILAKRKAKAAVKSKDSGNFTTDLNAP
jgi:hypothetical protein